MQLNQLVLHTNSYVQMVLVYQCVRQKVDSRTYIYYLEIDFSRTVLNRTSAFRLILLLSPWFHWVLLLHCIGVLCEKLGSIIIRKTAIIILHIFLHNNFVCVQK